MKVPAMKIIKRGFTLIELLVVISIIGILAAILLANLNSTRERARDATRQSDIKQYQTALGEFASENTATYPQYFTGTDICTLVGVLSLTTCIDDPQAPDVQSYQYHSSGTVNDGSAGAQDYVIWADLENGDWWVLCSNGLVGEHGTEPSSSVCPL